MKTIPLNYGEYINEAEIEEGPEIGRGSFGIVTKGFWRHRGLEMEVAMKELQVKNCYILQDLCILI